MKNEGWKGDLGATHFEIRAMLRELAQVAEEMLNGGSAMKLARKIDQSRALLGPEVRHVTDPRQVERNRAALATLRVANERQGRVRAPVDDGPDERLVRLCDVVLAAWATWDPADGDISDSDFPEAVEALHAYRKEHGGPAYRTCDGCAGAVFETLTTVECDPDPVHLCSECYSTHAALTSTD